MVTLFIIIIACDTLYVLITHFAVDEEGFVLSASYSRETIDNNIKIETSCWHEVYYHTGKSIEFHNS
jgi:hypothetical protein